MTQGTVSKSPGLSGSLCFHLDICFPTLLMGIHMGDTVKSLNKVETPTSTASSAIQWDSYPV